MKRRKRRMSHSQLFETLKDLVAAGAIAVINVDGRAHFDVTPEAALKLKLMRSRDAGNGDACRRPSPDTAVEASA